MLQSIAESEEEDAELFNLIDRALDELGERDDDNFSELGQQRTAMLGSFQFQLKP